MAASSAANIATVSAIAATRLWLWSPAGGSGDNLGARLRRPGEDKPGETFDFVLQLVAGAIEEGDDRPVLVRMDTGFPEGRTLEESDSPNIQYLERMAEPTLETPADRAPDEVLTVFNKHWFQTGNWSCKRCVALVSICFERELLPRYYGVAAPERSPSPARPAHVSEFARKPLRN